MTLNDLLREWSRQPICADYKHTASSPEVVKHMVQAIETGNLTPPGPEHFACWVKWLVWRIVLLENRAEFLANELIKPPSQPGGDVDG